MIRIGIFGATGYTGLELLKLLGRHPAARIVWLTSENSAGQQFGDVFPVPPALGAHTLIPSAEADCAGVDVVFCCLPHVAAQTHVAAARKAGARVIDLSADFRLRDAATYEKWYGHPHQHAESAGRGRLRPAGAAPGGDRRRQPDRQSGLLSHQHHPGPGAAGASGLACRHGHRRQQVGRLRRRADAVAQDAFRRGQREPQPVQHRTDAPASAGDGAGAADGR